MHFRLCGSDFIYGVIFLGHMNYYFWALKVISCALNLIKSPPRERKGEKNIWWSFMAYKMIKTSMINKSVGK